MKIDKKKFDIALANACMSFTDLSKKSNVSQFTISKLRTNPNANPSTIGKIAKALGVGVEELIKDTAATVNQFESQGFRLNNKGSESN